MRPYSLAVLRREDLVALDVGAHLLRRAAGVVRHRVLEPGAHAQHLVGLDLDVGRLAVVAARERRLVDEDARVGQGEPLARRAGAEQHRRGRGRLADDERLDVGPDELHRVVDRRHRRERATRAVDVHEDVAVGVERLQHEQLGDDVVGRRVVDLHAEEDDAVLEELVVGVRALHAVGGALLELRQDVAAGGLGHVAEARGGVDHHVCLHILRVAGLSCRSSRRPGRRLCPRPPGRRG